MARETLTQRIGLEGGKSIREEFAALGAEGERAFKHLKAAADQGDIGAKLLVSLDAIKARLREIRDRAREVGRRFNEMGAALRTTARRFALVTAAVAALGFVLFRLVLAGANAADAISKTAQSLGLTTEELGRLSFAARQSGVDAAQFQMAMQRLSDEIVRTQQSGNDMSTTLGRLGIRVTEANGKLRPTEAIVADLSVAFTKMKDGAEKTAIAMELFGSSAGPRLIPLLNSGKEGIAALGAEAERLGLVLSAEQALIGVAFQDAVDRTKETALAIQRDLALLFAPSLTVLADSLTNAIANNRAALLKMGEAVRDFVVPYVQDFIALLEGRESDVKNNIVIQFRDGVVSLIKHLQMALAVGRNTFNFIADALQRILDVINLIFGTDFEARSILLTGVLLHLLGVFRLLGKAASFVSGVFWLLTGTLGATTAALIAGAVAVHLIYVALEALSNLIFGAVKSAVQSIAEFFFGSSAEAAESVEDAGARMAATFEDVGDSSNDAADTIEEAMKRSEDRVLDVVGTISNALKKLAQFFGLVPGDEGSPAEGFAGGGAVHGPGTSKSDSIIARLSDGEYVVRAAAVRKYGVGILDALNRMRLPLSRLRGFSMGGLASSIPPRFSMPAFAEGGSVSKASQPLTLNIGGEVFEGLMAPEVVADRLTRYAMTKNIKRAGRTPGWY